MAWSGPLSSERARPLLRGLSLLLLTVVLGLVLFGWVLVRRGQAALEESDRAFHQGHMEESIDWAKRAGLAYVPGAEHVHRAEARLEAIARGAEAESRLSLARRAWDALRLVDEQTSYPGRPASAAGERARAALERLGRPPSGARSGARPTAVPR